MGDTEVLDAPPSRDVEDAFNAALSQDAAVTPPDVPAPPRQAASADPDAPHGRDENNVPLAPYGINKKTQKPNLRMPGPGRGRRTEEPRTTTRAAAPAADTPKNQGGGLDYTEDLAGLATTIWIGASAVKGQRIPLLGIPTPDLRPYAAVWHHQMPQMVGAWNTAAKQSPAVRRWVEKFAGEGSWQWVIGVSVVSANFLAACSELAKKDVPGHELAGELTQSDLRGRYAAHNDATLKQYLTAAIAEQLPEGTQLEDAA